MYTQITSYIFIIALNCLVFSIFSMEYETSVVPLQKSICTIPVLYIDNYIVNVSSAYKALKKEIFIVDDMAKGINLERINARRRRESDISFLFEAFASQRYIKCTFPQKLPGFLRINATCSQSLYNQNIYIKYDIVSYVYNTDLWKIQYILCPEELNQDTNWKAKIQECLSEIVVAALQDMTDQEISGTCGVEVYCPNRLADWLIIEKNF